MNSLKSREKYFEQLSRSGCKEKEKTLEQLHSQLQEETQKIVRWKVTTEVELDQKTRELDQAFQTIKALRNNLVEEQLRAEHLSHNLVQEKAHREQVDAKVERTRYLCMALKQHQDDLAFSVNEFSGVRQYLTSIHEEASHEIHHITSQFNELTEEHGRIVRELRTKANSEIDTLKEENRSLVEKVDEKSTSLIKLESQNQIQEERINKSEFTISMLESDLETVTSSRNATIEELEMTKLNLDEVSKELKKKSQESEEKILNLQISLASEKDKLAESKSEFEEATGKIQFLKKVNDTLEVEKGELQQQLGIVREKKDEVAQELTNANLKFDEFFHKAAETEAVLKGQISYLGEKVKDTSSTLESFKLEKKTLEDDHRIAVTQWTHELKEAEAARLNLSTKLTQHEAKIQVLQEKNEELTCQTKILNETVDKKSLVITELEDLKKAQQVKLSLAKEELEGIQRGKEDLEMQLKQERSHIQELRSELRKLKEELINANTIAKANTDSFEMQKTAFENEISDLTEQNKRTTEACNNSSEVLKALLEKIKILEESKVADSANMTALHEELLTSKEALTVANRESISLNEELKDLQIQYSDQAQEFDKLKKEMLTNVDVNDKLKSQVVAMQEELAAEQASSLKLENEVKEAKKSVTTELKKSKKLKLRILNLQKKLKNQEEDSKSSTSRMETLVEEKKEMESLLNKFKREATEKEGYLRNCLQETNDAKTEVEEKLKASSAETKEAKLETESKVKEIMGLMEDYNMRYEIMLKNKDKELQEAKQDVEKLEHNLEGSKKGERDLENEKKELRDGNKKLESENDTLRKQLRQQIDEMDRLKTSLKSLTSPRTSFFMDNLATSPFGRSWKDMPIRSSLEVPTVRSPFARIPNSPPKTERSSLPLRKPILISNATQLRKSVSFSSPKIHMYHDSDSSVDAYAFELGSDTDDCFDAVRRPSGTTPLGVRQGVPQANIQPICREAQTKTKNLPAAGKVPSNKKPRYDRSSLRTYSSPKDTPTGEFVPPAEGRHSKPKSSSTGARNISFNDIFHFQEEEN